MSPFPNEHACRLRQPGDFKPDSFRRTEREHEGKKYSVIMGRLKGEDTMTEQAYRYPKETWDAGEAGSHCRSHDGKFEAASGEEAAGAGMARKGYVCKTEDASDSERTIVSRISTVAVDRDMEVMLPGGMDLSGYNGVVLWAHDYRSETLPVGRNLWIKASETEVIAKTQFNDLPFSRDVYRLYRDGYLNAWSIGFNEIENRQPTAEEIKAHEDWLGVRRIHTKWELLEYSACKIPANREALTLAVSKGFKIESKILAELQVGPKLILAPRIVPAIVPDRAANIGEIVRQVIYKRRGGV